MIRTTECFEACCDVCSRGYGGASDGEDEDHSAHYTSREALDRSLASSDWSSIRERLLCPECQRETACALLGHQWEGWESVDVESYTGRRRACRHCDWPEYDPPRSTANRRSA